MNDSIGLDKGLETIRRQFQAVIEKQKHNMQDIALSVAGVSVFNTAWQTDIPDVTPLQEKAFELAFPNLDLSDAINNFDLINAWKGKIFELEVLEKLNSGEPIGGLSLEPSQIAVLADSPTQEGWDIQIQNSDGSIATDIQAKATEQFHHIKQALTEGPEVVCTNEFFDVSTDTSGLHAVTDISEQGIEDSLVEVIAEGYVDELLGSLFPLAALSLSNDKEATLTAMLSGGVAAWMINPFIGLIVSVGVRGAYRDFRQKERTLEALRSASLGLNGIAQY